MSSYMRWVGTVVLTPRRATFLLFHFDVNLLPFISFIYTKYHMYICMLCSFTLEGLKNRSERWSYQRLLMIKKNFDRLPKINA